MCYALWKYLKNTFFYNKFEFISYVFPSKNMVIFSTFKFSFTYLTEVIQFSSFTFSFVLYFCHPLPQICEIGSSFLVLYYLLLYNYFVFFSTLELLNYLLSLMRVSILLILLSTAFNRLYFWLHILKFLAILILAPFHLKLFSPYNLFFIDCIANAL